MASDIGRASQPAGTSLFDGGKKKSRAAEVEHKDQNFECRMCYNSGLLWYYRVRKDGRDITSAVATCWCPHGEYFAERQERIGNPYQRYDKLPPELGSTDLTNGGELWQFNYETYAMLAQKIDHGYFDPETHKWIAGKNDLGNASVSLDGFVTTRDTVRKSRWSHLITSDEERALQPELDAIKNDMQESQREKIVEKAKQDRKERDQSSKSSSEQEDKPKNPSSQPSQPDSEIVL